MNKLNKKNLRLVVRTLLLVIALILLKYGLHFYGLEILPVNSLFSGIIAANVFLMGFLLSGVLSDYKESEKIPGEIAASLHSIYDELEVIHLTKSDSPEAKEGMEKLLMIAEGTISWFYQKITTQKLLEEITGLYHCYASLESITQITYIVRLKNETAALKKLIIRADTIRDTNFISSGYLIAIITTALMCMGLAFSQLGGFTESLFFVGVISFLMIFLLLLIHDLDNPFGYQEKASAEDVSLYPIKRMIQSTTINDKGEII